MTDPKRPAQVTTLASGLTVVTEQPPSGGFAILRHRAPRPRTVVLPNGERAKRTVDDSGTVVQYERDEGLDAVVRPRIVTILRKG
jgi:hypothetical protein